MKSKNERALDVESGSPDVAGASRQSWEAPRVQRLATSTAEIASTHQVDQEGLS